MSQLLTRLTLRTKLVQKRMVRRDRALVDGRRAVCPICTLLEETVPMLNLPSRVPAFNNELKGENELEKVFPDLRWKLTLTYQRRSTG